MQLINGLIVISSGTRTQEEKAKASGSCKRIGYTAAPQFVAGLGDYINLENFMSEIALPYA